MSNLQIEVYVLGLLQTNVYLVSNRETKECVIIDPADRPDFIMGRIEEGGYLPKGILITHGHSDHIKAAPALEEAYGLQRTMYETEREFDLIGFHWKVLYTPGHTADSCCYYLEKEKVLFSGDTVFRGTYGKTDPPTGSFDQIRESFQKKIFTLPDDVTALPGHGEPTNIGWEKIYNMIIMDLDES